MTVEMTLVQTCDVGGETRTFDLKKFQPFRMDTIDNIVNNAGWREIKSGKHICAECIQKALNGNLVK